jgi:hypothetical protein
MVLDLFSRLAPAKDLLSLVASARSKIKLQKNQKTKNGRTKQSQSSNAVKVPKTSHFHNHFTEDFGV